MQDSSQTPSTSSTSHDTFAEDMGRLLELGFITGFLTALSRHSNVITHFGELYQQDLSSLRFQPISTKLCERAKVISTWDKEILEHWALFLLVRGYLAGLNFFKEYFDSFKHEKPVHPRDIVYLQCNFYGQNSLETYPKNERAATQELMKQFHAQGYPIHLTEEAFQEYTSKGKFLRADVLMVLRYGRQWRILSIDLSVFALRSLKDAGDLRSVEYMRQLLTIELHYSRSKSVFANLSIDTDVETTAPEILSGKLRHYFTAFKRKDKETVKLIQAASYAHSFYEFLMDQEILTPQDQVIFNIVGYTDRAVNAMTLRKEQFPVLATCADIYQNATVQEVQQERSHVLDTIRKAASKSFDNGKAFIDQLLHLADQGDGTHWLTHQETLHNFVNTRAPLPAESISPAIRQLFPQETYEGKNIQVIHEHLTKQALASPNPYLFLTAHPGIGKTTAVVTFLKERALKGEGFLFLYASPRKQVNLDIIRKFREDEFGLHCKNLFALTANTALIRGNHAKPTVHYYSHQRRDRFSERGVDFISLESEEAKRQYATQRRLEEIQEGLLIDKGERISGVLDSLCTAIYASLEKPLSNAIVATVAIQSLKRTHRGTNSTLRHLDKIFQGAHNKGIGVIPAQMQKLGQHIQHIFVMIDEVTGDESGAEFIEGIHTFLQRYGLLQSSSGINTKIIVADASIVDPQIIKQHLAETTYEPDKIYFRRVTPEHDLSALSRHEFAFKRLPAVVLNANAYPAQSLRITYNIGVDAIQYDEETYTDRSKQLRNELQQHIIDDILEVLKKPGTDQLLVYIQDKLRLAQLIQAIRKQGGTFLPNEDYLEIHANISEEDKQSIEHYQDTVKVVFMTASASRGLSFKKAKHILIDIPHFEIEQNLMEILQVMYRGRGGTLDQEEKTLTFYLSDRIVYTESADRDLSVRESILHLLNVLLILKTSLMTRIVGSGQIGFNQRFMMIPIGGKSVFTAGDTLTARMGRLIKDLQDLSHRHWNDPRLSYVATYMTRLLSQARIRLLPTQQEISRNTSAEQSYIPLLPNFSQIFEEAARKGFDHLLQLPNIERACMTGGLVVVPIENHMIQETYWMDVKMLLEKEGTKMDILTCMEELSRDKRYHENVHLTMRDALTFVRQLQKMTREKTSHYEQESSHVDQHYALPLFAFLAYKETKAYFETAPESEENPETSFHALLAAYIRTFYPMDSILPISRNYKAFPFLVFRSFNLGEARRKMFTERYLFMSHEFNILNMLLSSKDDR